MQHAKISSVSTLLMLASKPMIRAISKTSLVTCGVSTGGIELKCDPANESDAYLRAIDVMPVLWPGCRSIQCPVSLLAGSDISDNNPTEFIAHYIEDTLPLFQQARFERWASLTSGLVPCGHCMYKSSDCLLDSSGPQL